MKRVWGVLLVLGMMMGASAHEFQKMATNEPQLLQKGDSKEFCSVCAMNLKMFYKTSYGVTLKDGSAKQYCSIHCLVSEWDGIVANIDTVVVIDAKTEKMIDAKKAVHVVGSNVPGTMSAVSTLAFAEKADADEFMKEHGGESMNFESAFAKAKALLANDHAMLHDKREKGVYPVGEKIYTSQCQKEKIDLHQFHAINELKGSLKTTKACGELDEKQLQAVSLYLWDVVRQGDHAHHAHALSMNIDKDEKCPVCGMFPHKYPKWATRMTFTADSKTTRFAFDGAKDMLKFYTNPARWGHALTLKNGEVSLLVMDYYSQAVIDGKSAFYVIGSDVMGPMGREFIAFSKEADAKGFLKDHKGTRIVKLHEIDEALVLAQDQ